jgi:glycine dehydrogenase
VAIAQRVKLLTEILAIVLEDAGAKVTAGPRFDTVAFESTGESRAAILARARKAKVELRELDDTRLSATLDEAVTLEELDALIQIVTGKERQQGYDVLVERAPVVFEGAFARTSDFLTHPTFHRYHAEHELLRYMYRLQQRDLSLTTSMIPLGSCTMKLNATAEMIPVTMEGFGAMHPFTDPENASGYRKLTTELESMLAEITGLPGVSLQPNAGSQGEYAGLLTIRAHLEATGQQERNICLIPSSAHGTNPASAVMAGMKVVVVACDDLGNVDVEDLREKAEKHRDALAALMVTYPSTHGVFEEKIVEICQIVHDAGGQVYMDGANMNAQVGLCRPGDFGVDVCHLNLHKTFCIPHGGGGPGVGPIAVAAHLRPYLPGHNVVKPGKDSNDRPVSAAPWGSAGILPISWMYMRLMGAKGLKKATQVAILNANYLARKLEGHYDVLYTGKNGTVAHEFILDLRPLAKSCEITVVDVAKRLMDYGFHAPTMSWPVPGSLMIEPTESESKEELDRFAEAMISIRNEIAEIESGVASKEDNVLVNAPHTVESVMGNDWAHSYTRERAAFPASWSREAKFWPAVSRIDDAFGDRNLVCSCPPLSDYEE